MWGFIAAALGIGLIYELVTNWGEKRPTIADARKALQALEPIKQQVNLSGAAAAARAQSCGLQSTDWADTNRWTADLLGSTIDPVARLTLMHSARPYALWPVAAQRVWCTLWGQPKEASSMGGGGGRLGA